MTIIINYVSAFFGTIISSTNGNNNSKRNNNDNNNNTYTIIYQLFISFSIFSIVLYLSSSQIIIGEGVESNNGRLILKNSFSQSNTKNNNDNNTNNNNINEQGRKILLLNNTRISKIKHDFYTAREQIIVTIQSQYGIDNFYNMFVVNTDNDNNINNTTKTTNTNIKLRTLFDNGLPKYIIQNNNNTTNDNDTVLVDNNKYMSSLQSYNRMVRKVMKKIIQAQIQLNDYTTTTTQSGTTLSATVMKNFNTVNNEESVVFLEASSDDGVIEKEDIQPNDSSTSTVDDDSTTTTIVSSLVQFVWVTAGNSVAAGHGNLYNESYSAVVERNVQSMFQTVFNMNLIVRNYGISAMVSAPEASLCLNEIYGTDIDLLLWHFGLTDNGQINNLLLFLYRSLLHRNHPAVWALQIDGSIQSQKRRAAIQRMEETYNLTILSMNGTSVDTMIQTLVPDSFGLSDTEIKLLPEYVRNFRCSKGIESGDPYCEKERFTNITCTKRQYRVKWHPGWKWNAVIGNLASFSLLQILEDAILELEKYSNTNDDIITLYDQLLVEENDHYKENVIQKSPPSNLLTEFMDTTLFTQHDINFFVKSTSVCRTGLYPSEARIKGIFHPENDTSSDDDNDDDDDDEIATTTTTLSSSSDIVTMNNNGNSNNNSSNTPDTTRKVKSSTWKLTIDEILDTKDPLCTVPTAIDHRDYYNINYDEEWKTLIVPSPTEIEEYFYKSVVATTASTTTTKQEQQHEHKEEQEQPKLHGYIAICTMMYCPYRICQKGMLQRTALYNNSISIQVNGIVVTNVTKFSDCDLLINNNTYDNIVVVDSDNSVDKNNRDNNATQQQLRRRMIFPPNENGQYEISVKVNVEYSYFRISSIVVW